MRHFSGRRKYYLKWLSFFVSMECVSMGRRVEQEWGEKKISVSLTLDKEKKTENYCYLNKRGKNCA
jgi:hypothetical protein